MAITLVVFGHVLGGALARGWLHPVGVWQQVYAYIYLFHMPLFFMISGFFCIESMRRSPSDALLSLLGSIAWPYLLWDVLIRAALLPVIAAFMLHPPEMSWTEWLTKAAFGEYSWFLWTLFVMQAMLIPVARAPVWLLFLLSVCIYAIVPLEWLGPFRSVARYLPFLLFGAMLNPFIGTLTVGGSRPHLLAALSVFLLMAIPVRLGWEVYKPVILVCGIAGSIATMVLAQSVERARLRQLLAALGLASLAIYLLHPYFQGAAREITYRIVGSDTVAQLALVTAIAVAGPFLVWLVAERLGMPWLFRLRRASARRA